MFKDTKQFFSVYCITTDNCCFWWYQFTIMNCSASVAETDLQITVTKNGNINRIYLVSEIFFSGKISIGDMVQIYKSYVLGKMMTRIKINRILKRKTIQIIFFSLTRVSGFPLYFPFSHHNQTLVIPCIGADMVT